MLNSNLDGVGDRDQSHQRGVSGVAFLLRAFEVVKVEGNGSGRNAMAGIKEGSYS